MPETYAPVILKRRAQKLRKETSNASIVAPIELEKTVIGHIVTVVLTRPLFLHPHLLRLRHLLYLPPSLPNHGIGIYGFNAGEGLTFLPIDHRRRHLPMLGLDPPPGPSAQQAVGAQRRDAAAAARLPRGAVLRALALLGGLDGAHVRPLDRAHPRRHPVRHRLPVPVHGVAELPHRRVRDLCSQRHSCA